MIITIFDKSSGRILRVADVFLGGANLQLFSLGEDFIEGNYPDDRFYIDGYNPVAMPEQPSPHHVFDYNTKQWEDIRTLSELKLNKRAEIKQARDSFEFGGFAWNGYVFDSDRVSQGRIQGAVLSAVVAQSLGAPYSQDWTLADNTVLPLTGEQVIFMGIAMGTHIASAHEQSRILQAQIDAATTAEEVMAIHW